jgi:23S rRNA pseudouridine2605 synthase
LRDPQGRPTVRQLLPPGERLVPIGRLDQDSEGLLLFTNDGDLAQAVAHPSGGVAKRYRVWVHAPVSSAVLAQLRAGVHLEDGWCRPLEVHVVPAYRAEAGLSLDPARRPPGPWHVLDITLGEGRKREVRRLLARVGLRVYRLVRVAVGPIPLTGLPPGQYRYLEEEEMRALRARPAAGCGAGRAQMRLRRVQSPGGPSQAPAGCRKG